MKHSSLIPTFGYAVGLGGNDSGTAFAPLIMQNSPFLNSSPVKLLWKHIFYIKQSAPKLAALPAIAEACTKLAEAVRAATQQKKRFLVVGGDHTSGIGTWSGASTALSKRGDFGLIWLDAHLDSHTPKTTPSNNIHGMSLAVLLGYGDPLLKSILHASQKLKPQNLCIVGVRSYEPEELAFLNKLGVKIYYMDDIRKRGINQILAEAIEHVSKNTVGFGVSIDIDLFDPKDAPGVGVPEPQGISTKQFLKECSVLSQNAHFIGLEIVEFNPMLDQKQKTERLVAALIQTIFL